MNEHICPTCGNVERLVTPVIAYCAHCNSLRVVNVPPVAKNGQETT